MITVTHRESNRMADSMTGLFTGADHQADVSFFWVDETPGGGPAFHWHPYTETWVVLDGQVLIETQNKQREIEQFVATPGGYCDSDARNHTPVSRSRTDQPAHVMYSSGTTDHRRIH